MSNQLTKVFNGSNVRIVELNREFWFVAKDVCDILEISKHRDALSRLDEDERGSVVVDTLGGKQSVGAVNEYGLYSLVFNSRKPEAKEFKRWVTHEVLPSIRKNGAYMTEQTLERTMADPDFLIGLLTNLKEEQQARKQAEKVIEEQKPKVAFTNAVEVSVNSITVSQLAKLISQKGVNTGQNRLFEWLRDNGYLVKSGRNKNSPTQRYVDQGLFEIKTGSIIKPSGESHTTRTTLVTGKGQIYFVNKFLN